ncbi:hypothetical protein GA0074695_0568 [Micromonospora viridifaciens]|uniref:Phage integrase family protein n=1 Tax=Micromonospora viridifaciens TaxID=1881 RepID=A0A1C4UJW9_MICVI|nr:hypothetical protein GA0074695_0568 [Micromonospora viridifaciens]
MFWVWRARLQALHCSARCRSLARCLLPSRLHPRVAMQILRHGDFKITMEIYTKVSSKQTREALKRLGERMSGTESA